MIQEQLQKKFFEVSEKIYKQNAPSDAGQNPGAGAQSGPADDGVVDADFTEVDE